MSGHFSTLLRMIVSGSERAITAIMKARAVPRAAPFSSKASTIGMIPAALEYMGMPRSTASGTLHHAPSPMMPAMKSSGT